MSAGVPAEAGPFATTAPAPHFPVVVVGAGPTGLTLAGLLARYGVRVLLVERNTRTVQDPRAVSIDDESLRTMQAAGVIDEILPDVVPGYGSIYYSAKGKCFAKIEPTDTPYGYPRRNAFRQPLLEAKLRVALENSTVASALFGWELIGFSQDADAVEVLISNGEARQLRVSCAYLVGCDGAASTVRSTLGITLEGTTYAKRWLIVDLENSTNETKHTELYCDHLRPCITLPGPHRTRRFEFEVFADETDAEMLAPSCVERLLLEHGADQEATIRRKAIYRFHARVAPTWRAGRVLLAGDAAHLSPPFAGQGMNSGIRDAFNLAWKLAAVAGGRMGPKLLETYEQERRNHSWQMIRLALRMGRILSPRGPLQARVTEGVFHALNLWPPARNYITQMKYKPKPRFQSGFMVAGRVRRHPLVGCLLPQPKVVRPGGGEVLLDELLGTGFALILRTREPEGSFARLQQPIWGELGATYLAVLPRNAELALSRRNVDAVESGDELSLALRSTDEMVILVRPDRYVAACFPLREGDSAAQGVRELLRATWSG
jgi:3-(3-hydroxy-phenyl)propionate hydroxylase